MENIYKTSFKKKHDHCKENKSQQGKLYIF